MNRPYPQDRAAAFQQLKQDARGQWAYIFEDLAPQLAEAIAANGRHVSCPVHGGSNGFRLFKDYQQSGGGICNTCGAQPNGFGMLHWVKGYDFKDAVREVGQWIRKENATPTISNRPPPAPPAPVDTAKAQATIYRLWSGSRPLKGSAAQRYLEARGIWSENHPMTLRAHPSVRFFDSATQQEGSYPAMLAPVKNAMGQIVALHRTYLTEEGMKAPVPEVKKLTQKTGPLNGAAIKLFPSTEFLGVGEGIETMLAVRAITRMPVWSAVSAVLLEQVEIPEGVHTVVIWADNDLNGRGQQAAEVLAERLRREGKTVEIQIPGGLIPEGAKGIDWLDVLTTQGLEGFPAHWRVWQPMAQQG